MDASAAGPFLLPDEADTLSVDAMTMLLDTAVLVPMHWHLEVAGIVRKAVRRGRLALSDAETAFHRVAGLDPIVDSQTASQAWATTSVLAHQYDLTIYDAAYLELARRSSSRLATLDAKLASAAQAEGVELIALV